MDNISIMKNIVRSRKNRKYTFHKQFCTLDNAYAAEGDYCCNLTQFKIGTLNEVSSAQTSQQVFDELLDIYREHFKDDTIFQRLRFHLSVVYLVLVVIAWLYEAILTSSRYQATAGKGPRAVR